MEGFTVIGAILEVGLISVSDVTLKSCLFEILVY